MENLLSILIILSSVLLIAVVFVQNPKGGGLSSDLGSAHQIGGVKKTNDFIDKTTWTLIGTIMLCSIVLTIMVKPVEQKNDTGTEGQKTDQNAPEGNGSN
jgi:preprotein translocase subunit SecG